VRQIRLILILAGFLTSWIPTSKAQTLDCRSLLSSPHEKQDYQQRKYSERCEGFYASPVSRDGLVLTQFSYGLAPSADLNIVNIATPHVSELVRVAAVSTSLHVFYRMDAFIAPNGSLRWPLSDVLLPSHLHLSQFGVVAWLGNETNQTFVPVLLSDEHGSTSLITKPLNLGITSSLPLDRLVWRWADRVGSECRKYSSWQKVQSEPVIQPQKQIYIELQSSIKGDICFEAQGQEHESDTWYPLSAIIRIPK
jgi:hypothetical protein